MNSFNTDTDTKRVISKYETAGVTIYTFNQSRYPRLDSTSKLPLPVNSNEKENWYPPGHGDFLCSFVNSSIFPTILKSKKYIFLSNVDNIGAIVDPKIAKLVSDKDLDFCIELIPKSKNDLKGGTIIEYENRLTLMEIAQVPKDKVEDFQDLNKFKVFNTNNVWMNVQSVERVVKSGKLFDNIDIIENRKCFEGRNVIQLETAIGCAIAAFDKTCCVVVSKKRFLPVKTCNDLLVVRSDLYRFDDKTGLVVDGLISIDTIPPIFLWGVVIRLSVGLRRGLGLSPRLIG